MQILFIALSLLFTLARVCGFVRDDCYCGISITEGRRITKGVLAKPFKYPWMVALFNAHKKAFCGGTLISDRHVLTAAHCVSLNPQDTEFWLQVYGKIKSHHVSQGEKMNFNRINIHPLFKTYGTYDDYDLAILTFSRRIQTFSSIVTPICVPETRQETGGRQATVAGWGTTDANIMKMSPYLIEGEVQVLHPIQCPFATNLNQAYNFKSMLCAYSPDHVDTCQGDSGGPIFMQFRPNTFDIIGVSSFGAKCGGDYAGVYADITQSLSWVWSVINSTGICPRFT